MANEKDQMVQLAAQVPPDMKAEIERLAEIEMTSAGAIVRRALAAYLRHAVLEVDVSR